VFVFVAAGGPVLGCLFLDALVGVLGGGRDRCGGRVGAAPLGVRQDAGVCVGGDHDAGMAEQILPGLQIGAGLVGEGCGAVAQVLQPDGWQAGLLGEDSELRGGVVRVDRLAGLAGQQVCGVDSYLDRDSPAPVATAAAAFCCSARRRSQPLNANATSIAASPFTLEV
jgi:hypothetical protein